MLGLLEFLENWIKKTELKYTDLRAEGAKVGVFQFTPTFAPKARRWRVSVHTNLRAEGAKPACLHTTILTVLCSRYIVYMYYMYYIYYMYCLKSIFVFYIAVLFVLIVLFVYDVSFVAMLHLHLWWFYWWATELGLKGAQTYKFDQNQNLAFYVFRLML